MFFDKDKDKKKEPEDAKRPEGQPESKDIWKDLNNVELGWCCKFLQEMLKTTKMTHMYFANNSGESVGMKLNHCPRCGRRLVEGKIES